MNRWTVHVKNFGKIEEASVEVAPLTLFVGDNNSGKSYMMTLIYGLLNANFFFDKYEFDDKSDLYLQCCAYIDKLLLTEHQKFYILEGAELQTFQKLLNEILERNSAVFLRKLFNKEMSIGALKISFPKDLKLEFRIRREIESEENPEDISITLTENQKSIVSGYGIELSKFQHE